MPHKTAASTAATQPRRSAAIRVVKTLWPGQPGTVRLARTHGTALVCVRYRHDASGWRRYTTVEIVVEEALVTGPRFDRTWFNVRLDYRELTLQQQAQQLGARWNAVARVWRMKGAAIRKLGIIDRILGPAEK